MEEGLAGQGIAIVEQIMELLQQGMSPEELIANGVPEELVVIAIQQLQAMASAPSMEPDSRMAMKGENLL